MKKDALKIIICIILAPVAMMLNFAVACVAEIALQSDFAAAVIQLFFGAAMAILLIIAESRFIEKDMRLTCNCAFFAAAIAFGWLALPPIAAYYLQNFHPKFTPYAEENSFRGLTAVVYLIIAYGQFAFHLAARLFVAGMRKLKNE